MPFGGEYRINDPPYRQLRHRLVPASEARCKNPAWPYGEI
jgi:hypothetical protein